MTSNVFRRDGKWVFRAPTRSLVESRIWFWQQDRYIADGWTIRRPGFDGDKRVIWRRVFAGLFRLTVARFDEGRHIVPKVEDRFDGGVPPFGADLGGHVSRDCQPAGLALGGVKNVLDPVGSARGEDFVEGLVEHDEQPVEHRKPKLTLNQKLELLGHFIHRPTPFPDVSKRVAEAAARKGQASPS